MISEICWVFIFSLFWLTFRGGGGGSSTRISFFLLHMAVREMFVFNVRFWWVFYLGVGFYFVSSNHCYMGPCTDIKKAIVFFCIFPFLFCFVLLYKRRHNPGGHDLEFCHVFLFFVFLLDYIVVEKNYSR